MLTCASDGTFLEIIVLKRRWPLKSSSNTAIFVKAATTLWNCINVKSKDPWFKLNDENRKTFEWVDDQRLEFILLLAGNSKISVLLMDTSNVLHLFLNDKVSLIKLFLTKFYQKAFKVIDWNENSEFFFSLQK